MSSATSSSISVVSVPLEVTGDGPTISLGLRTWKLFDDIRFAELGRREVSFIMGGEDLYDECR
jgi:hypothetical protein